MWPKPSKSGGRHARIKSLPSYLQLHPLKQQKVWERKRSTIREGQTRYERDPETEMSHVFFSYIKLHEELLVIRLDSFFCDGLRHLLHVSYPLSLQSLLHLLLHQSLSCCFCLCFCMCFQLVQPSQAQSTHVLHSWNNQSINLIRGHPTELWFRNSSICKITLEMN